MIARFVSSVLVLYVLGFALFAVALPGPAGAERTDAVVVPTGGPGRIARGLQVIKAGAAKRMLVTGVDPTVRAGELAAELGAPRRLFDCCVDLGQEAVDTRSNGEETASWLRRNRFRSLRLVTTDWHMARARFELRREIGDEVRIVNDGVRSDPSFRTLFGEYNKYLLRRAAVIAGY